MGKFYVNICLIIVHLLYVLTANDTFPRMRQAIIVSSFINNLYKIYMYFPNKSLSLMVADFYQMHFSCPMKKKLP